MAGFLEGCMKYMKDKSYRWCPAGFTRVKLIAVDTGVALQIFQTPNEPVGCVGFCEIDVPSWTAIPPIGVGAVVVIDDKVTAGRNEMNLGTKLFPLTSSGACAAMPRTLAGR